MSVTAHLLTHSLDHSLARSLARSHKYSLEIAHVLFTIFALSQPAHNQLFRDKRVSVMIYHDDIPAWRIEL